MPTYEEFLQRATELQKQREQSMPPPKKTPVEPSFREQTGKFLGGVAQKRGREMQKSIQSLLRGEQNLKRTKMQVLGQGAGAASDVIGGAMMGTAKLLLPKQAEKTIAETATRGIGSLLKTRPGQFVAQKGSQVSKYLAQDKPETRDIKAILGAGSLATDIGIGGLAKKGAQTGAKPMLKQMAKRSQQKSIKKVDDAQKTALKLYEKATDIAPGSKKAYQDRFKEPLAKYLRDEQIPLDIEANKLKTVSARERVDELLDLEETNLQQVLSTKNKTHSLSETLAKAKQKVVGELEEEAIQTAMEKFLSGRKKQVLTSGEFNSLKRKFNKFYDRGDSAKNEAARAIQRVMRQELIDTYSTDNVLKNILARMSKHLEAKNALVKMEDKVIRGGKLGRQLSQMAGAATLAKIPIIGPILGYEMTGKIVDYLLDANRLTRKAIQELQSKNIVPNNLKSREEVLNFLRKDLIKKIEGKDEILMLPEGKTKTPFSGIIAPSPKRKTEFEAPAKKINMSRQRKAVPESLKKLY